MADPVIDQDPKQQAIVLFAIAALLFPVVIAGAICDIVDMCFGVPTKHEIFMS